MFFCLFSFHAPKFALKVCVCVCLKHNGENSERLCLDNTEISHNVKDATVPVVILCN